MLNKNRTVGLGPFLLLVLLGCDRGPTIVPVTGTVSFDGKPLAYGSVMFQPIGGGKIARGKIEADGGFSLTTIEPGDGAIVGKHRVRITAFEAQAENGSAVDMESEPTLGKSAIPQKYNSFATSGIEVQVEEGMKPIELKAERRAQSAER